MRHRKLSRRFSRTSSHRTAMMRNLAISLIEHEIVKTTVEKGKYLRTFLEPLITKSKNDTLHNRRKVISSLNSQTAASKLFSDISPKLSETNGGYLRIIKAGFRPGDKADMCFVELTCRDPEKNLSDTTLEDDAITSPDIAPAPEPTQVKSASETDAVEKEAKKPTSKKEDDKKPAPKKEEKKESWWKRFVKNPFR